MNSEENLFKENYALQIQFKILMISILLKAQIVMTSI